MKNSPNKSSAKAKTNWLYGPSGPLKGVVDKVKKATAKPAKPAKKK